MADTKISALSAAAALGGTEELAGVQTGANAKITPAQIKTYCRTRADVLVESVVSTNMTTTSNCNSIVRTAAGIYYIFFISGINADFYYKKSTDYGVSWGSPVEIKAGITAHSIGVWFDKWTPGDSGTLIHITYAETTAGDSFYRSLDTAAGVDTLGTEVVAFAGTSGISATGTSASITKTKGSRIVIIGNIDAGTEVFSVKSDDYPVTAFSALANSPHEATSDFFIALPGSYADTADFDLIFWDSSANEITLKTFDDSAGTWSESSAITAMTDIAATTANPQFAAATRGTDGHHMLVAWSNADTLNATLRFWDVNGAASVPGTPVTISTSTDDQALCAISIDTDNDDLYVYYAGADDGSDTAYTSLGIKYKRSTDDGATWGAETALSTADRAVTYLLSSAEIAAAEHTVLWGGIEMPSAIAMQLRTSALA